MWITSNLKVLLTTLKHPPDCVKYGFINTKFGRLLLGVLDLETKSKKAICLLYFVRTSDDMTLKEAHLRWPKSQFQLDAVLIESYAKQLFDTDKESENAIEVAVFGSEFQVAVWTALLQVEMGCTCTYMQLAESIGRANAVRAVASAVGKNEVSVVIPCHRIVSKNGDCKYGWGAQIKMDLLKYEENTRKK